MGVGQGRSCGSVFFMPINSLLIWWGALAVVVRANCRPKEPIGTKTSFYRNEALFEEGWNDEPISTVFTLVG